RIQKTGSKNYVTGCFPGFGKLGGKGMIQIVLLKINNPLGGFRSVVPLAVVQKRARKQTQCRPSGGMSEAFGRLHRRKQGGGVLQVRNDLVQNGPLGSFWGLCYLQGLWLGNQRNILVIDREIEIEQSPQKERLSGKVLPHRFLDLFSGHLRQVGNGFVASDNSPEIGEPEILEHAAGGSRYVAFHVISRTFPFPVVEA